MNKTSSQKLFFSFRAFFWFLAMLVIFQLLVGVYAYRQIGQTYEGSPDINIVGSLRMLVQRINGSTIIISSDMYSLATWEQLQTDIQRADRIIYGLRHGDTSLRLVPLSGGRQLELLNILETEWPQYIQNIEHLVVAGSQMSPEEKQPLVQQISLQANYMVSTIDELTFLEQGRNRSSLQFLTIIFLAGGIISTILIIIFWYLFLQKGFIRPLSNLLPALEAVMNGDTKKRVPEEGTQSTRKIAANYNQLADNLQSTYINISRDLSSLLIINNKLIYLSRQLLDSTKPDVELELINTQLEEYKEDRIDPEILEKITTLQEKYLGNNEDIASLTNNIIRLLTRQSLHAEELRDKQVFLELSLCDEELIDLLIIDLEMRRQRAYLYSMGHGDPDHIGDCRLDRWQKGRGEQLLNDHPRFGSLLEHHKNLHQALNDLIESVTNNSTENLQEELSRVDTFAELSIIDLQHLKAACQ